MAYIGDVRTHRDEFSIWESKVAILGILKKEI